MASKYQRKLERRKEAGQDDQDDNEFRKDSRGLRWFMGAERRRKLGNRMTLHSECMALFGVARPGKTARDRSKIDARNERKKEFAQWRDAGKR